MLSIYLEYRKASDTSEGTVKVGILTHYYQSTNYGGNFQAYALAEICCSLGCDTELICYVMKDWKMINAPETKLERIKSLTPKRFAKGMGYRIYKKFWDCMGAERKRREVMRIREEAFYNFNQNVIRHSKKIYDDSNITDCIQIYDAFITGSDQVWNPDCYLKPFYLDFVPQEKKKIAYAASVAKDKLTQKELFIFRSSLKTFHAVSVREKRSVELLRGVSPAEIYHLLDPTLLLDATKWEKLTGNTPIEEDYIFCYFLGTNTGIYKDIKKFAKQRNLKIVNIPFMSEKYVWSNGKLGDINVMDAGPEKFLALVKNASYVFTDSYHAVIFSYVFKKQFFVFNRDREHDINARIYDILEILELTERFCDTHQKERLPYFSELKEINYNRYFTILENKKQSSIEFLKRSLKGGE